MAFAPDFDLEGYLTRLRQIESGGDDGAISSTGAKGPYQFTSGTWKQYGNGGNPFDPADAKAAATRLTQANYNTLQSALGRAPTTGELYLAHQQGAQGAINLLSNPNGLASDAVGAQAISVNGGNPNMTAGDFANMWSGKFGSGPAATPSVSASGAPSGWDHVFAAAGLSNPGASASAPSGAGASAAPAMQNPFAALQQKPQQPLLARLLFGDQGFNGMMAKALPTPNNGMGLIGGLFSRGATPQAATPAPSAAATPSPATSLPTFAQGNTPPMSTPLATPTPAGGGPAGSMSAASSPLSGGAGLLGQGLGALGSGLSSLGSGGGLGALGSLFSMI